MKLRERDWEKGRGDGADGDERRNCEDDHAGEPDTSRGDPVVHVGETRRHRSRMSATRERDGDGQEGKQPTRTCDTHGDKRTSHKTRRGASASLGLTRDAKSRQASPAHLKLRLDLTAGEERVRLADA